MPTVYTFEAKSIQSYILDSSKLKDMVGASELIENLCAKGGLLDNVLEALSQTPDFSRRAGGAFTAFFDDKTKTDAENLEAAENFQAAWTYCIQQTLPGLDFVQGMREVKGDDDKAAIKAVNEAKDADRNRLYPRLPEAGPLVARYPRTGGASVARRQDENLDEITLSKRFFQGKALLDKLNAFTDEADKPHWPEYFPDADEENTRNLEDRVFPLLPENRYVGIIHADGNEMGQIIHHLTENVPGKDCRHTLRTFSEALEKATLNAVRAATRDVLMKYAVHQADVLPARPLVVGGDDLSFVVRGDVALPFAETFLEKFESLTKEYLKKLHQAYPQSIPEHLTACAGIAFVKIGQPFYQAYHLAESLCKHAKVSAREKRKSKSSPMPSALAFHRITTSMIDDYETIVDRELTGDNDVVLSMQPYFLGNIDPTLTPRLSTLQDFADTLRDQKISRGAMRELLDLLHLNPQQAKDRFQRWQDNMEKSKQGKTCKSVLDLLGEMTGGTHPDLPQLLCSQGGRHYSPLGDALALNMVRRGGDDE